VATDTIETPFGKIDNALGGSATYASISASYFANPGIVGLVGGDFEKKHINLLKHKGVDLDGLQIEKSGKTFHWSGYYEGDMNQAHTRATHLNVFESFKPEIPEAYKKAPYIMLGNIHPALQLDVLSQVKGRHLVLCDTMNFWISSEPKLLEKVFRKVDIICINDGEARQFCGTDSLSKAAGELLRLGPKRVIIKKGAHGVLLFGKNSFFALPAIPLKTVKDPTGAGDTFAGGTIGYLARSGRPDEGSFRKSMVIGTVMASFCVEDFSLRRTSRLTKSAINGRIALLKKYTEFSRFSI